MSIFDKEYQEDPIHIWFELSYSHFLTIPRSILEAMPYVWQQRMVKLLEELDETLDWRPEEGSYWVQLRTRGRYKFDKLSNYRHPDYKYLKSLIKKSTQSPNM